MKAGRAYHLPKQTSAGDREMLVPVRRSVDYAGPTNYPVAGQASPHARGTPQKLLIRELVDASDTAVVADQIPEEEELAGLQQSVWGMINIGVLEIGLMLGMLLLGALRTDSKMSMLFTSVALTLVWAVATVPVVWCCCSLLLLGGKFPCAQVLGGNTASDMVEETLQNPLDGGRTCRARTPRSTDNGIVKPVNGAPLVHRFPKILQTCQGGG